MPTLNDSGRSVITVEGGIMAIYEEDARVLAAAPDLLEAARDLLAWMDERGPMMGGQTAAVREKVREAIAKAEGSQP